MKLTTSNDKTIVATWQEAVLSGIGPAGGLYLPVSIPVLSKEELDNLRARPFSGLASEIAAKFLDDEVPREVLDQICQLAFTFDVPLVPVNEVTFILELFHGPTCAFKDFGARFMAGLFKYFLGIKRNPLTVLVATSGDTGSAVANAFLDTDPAANIKVVVLFPKGKVSLVQEKQMTTLGHNITAIEVEGNFDDCQRLVKLALADHVLQRKVPLTSANSINIARLLPQLMYYVYAYLKLPEGSFPVFSVPSGNLGNVTGGVMARAMGMPTKHFVVGCNANDVFPEFLLSGVFKARPSVETISNAMDVGNPSNYTRIMSLFDGSVAKVRSVLTGYGITDEATKETIKKCYHEKGYVLDPHTAVGLLALQKYRQAENATTTGIVLATAHPAKFGAVVNSCIQKEVEVPPQLEYSLKQAGIKIPMDSHYESLESLLLSTMG